MIDRFCLFIDKNRGFSKNTIGNYRRTLNLFKAYLDRYWKDIDQIDKISLKDINDFIFVQRLYKSAVTCNNYLSAIRTYLYFWMSLGLEVVNPKLLLNQRTQTKKIESLNDDETRILLEYFKKAPCWESKWDELIKVRNYLMLLLLVYTWIRVSELVNIRVEDIGETLIVRGKGWKIRPIKLFSDELAQAKLYLFMRRNFKSEYLFISFANNSRGEGLSRNAVEKIISGGAIKAWITTKVFPHKLRHTFATNLLRRNANLYHIKELLGHASITTTQTYLTVRNYELANTQKLLPRF